MLGRRRLAALLATGALVAIPLAGCGGGDDNGGDGTAAESGSNAGSTAAATGPGGTVDLSGTDFKFSPSDPKVKSGAVTFVLKNDGQAPHSLEIEDVNGEDKELEGDVAPGQSGTLKVDLQPGTYEFYCPVDGHRDMGMTGEITVQ
jgi:uncharacterized cupredoxin-like copper-binding protein